jgi:hypothetical protein
MSDHRRLMKYVGERDGRPVYLGTTCPGGDRRLIRDTGLTYAGRRVFVSAECEADGPAALLKYVGERDGRPVYVGACCPGELGCCGATGRTSLTMTFHQGALDGFSLALGQLAPGTEQWGGSFNPSFVGSSPQFLCLGGTADPEPRFHITVTCVSDQYVVQLATSPGYCLGSPVFPIESETVSCAPLHIQGGFGLTCAECFYSYTGGDPPNLTFDIF